MVESIPLSNAPPFSVSNRFNEMLLEQNRTEHIQWDAPLAAIVLKSPLDLPVVRTSPDHKTFNSPPMDAVRLIYQYAHQIQNIHIPDKHRNTKKRFKQPSKLYKLSYFQKSLFWQSGVETGAKSLSKANNKFEERTLRQFTQPPDFGLKLQKVNLLYEHEFCQR